MSAPPAISPYPLSREEELDPLLLATRLLTNATPGPWWIEDDEDTWILQGVAARIPSSLFGEQIINSQILKAPKHSTPYAEYWPNDADAELIMRARELLASLAQELTAARAALAATR